MASNFSKITKSIMQAMQGAVNQGTSSYDSIAEVRRVENGTAWVHIAGGVDETPVKLTVDAKAGDFVQVRVGGGRAWITGNATSPPTDDTIAKYASSTAVNAKILANEAIEDAATAKTAAESAQESAEIAKTSADSAQESAEIAKTSADTAQVSANNANEYAARALGNLSTVQSVAETLTWITQHGKMDKTKDYVLSADTEVVEGKKYYTRSGTGTEEDPYVFTLVSDPTGDPTVQGYYEGQLDPTHVYFVLDANGDYTVGTDSYSIVSEPVVDDIASYYVLTIDESLNNYVGSHLAVTAEGLWVLPENNSYKILVATGSGVQYTEAGTYVIDGTGGTVAKFGATARVGVESGKHVLVDSSGFGVFLGAESVASNKVASFGETVRIGKNNAAKVEIGSNSIHMFSDGSDVFEIIASDADTGEVTQSLNSMQIPVYLATAGTAPTTWYTITLDEMPLVGSTIEVRCNKSAALHLNAREFFPMWQDTILSITAGEAVVDATPQLRWYGAHEGATGGHDLPMQAYYTYDGLQTIKIGIKLDPTPQISNPTETVTSGHLVLSDVVYTANNVSGSFLRFGSRYPNSKSGAYSITMGEGLEASSAFQLACGRYNNPDSSMLFMVGNGSENSRRNAFSVDVNGKMFAESFKMNENYVIDGYKEWSTGYGYLSNAATSRIVRFGSICHCTLYCYNTSAVNKHEDLIRFTPSIPTRLLPLYTVTGCTYYGRWALPAKMDSNGRVVVRNATEVDIPANTMTDVGGKNIVVSFFYMCKG